MELLIIIVVFIVVTLCLFVVGGCFGIALFLILSKDGINREYTPDKYYTRYEQDKHRNPLHVAGIRSKK